MKKFYLLLSAFCICVSSLAAVTRETEWQNVPDTTKVGEVVDLANVNGGAARPLPPYLHAIRFFDSYPKEAELYYDWVYGNCSSVREGGFHSRNYDWNFDYSCVFVTLMEPNEAVGRHGSVGVSGVGTNLTEEVVTSGKWSKWYKALPGHTLDGINDAGVAVNINVVSSHGVTNGWHALSSDTNSIHALGAVRWVLDNADSASFAATSLAARVWVPQKMLVAGYSVHYMISDANETWVAEEGKARLVSRGERVAMTNFRLFDKMDGRHDPYGTGYERWDLLMAGENITNAWFTKAYEYATEPRRYSEFIAEGVYNITSAWQTAAALWAAKPKEQHRGEKFGDNTWWQTLHTSIYDISNRVLRVAVQETDDWYTFAVPVTAPKIDAYTKAETDAKLAEKIGGGDVPDYEQDPTATAQANAAIAAAGLDYAVKTNEYGYIEGWIAIQDARSGEPSINFSPIGTLSATLHGESYLTWSGLLQAPKLGLQTVGYFTWDGFYEDYTGVKWMFPFMFGYGMDSTHDIALVSQIEEATNGLVSATSVTNLVVNCRDTYHDDELDVTFKKVVSGGRVFMKVIAVDGEDAE